MMGIHFVLSSVPCSRSWRVVGGSGIILIIDIIILVATLISIVLAVLIISILAIVVFLVAIRVIIRIPSICFFFCKSLS